jgi:hypothetical protein
MEQISKDLTVLSPPAILRNRTDRISRDVPVWHDLREPGQDLKQQMRSALGLGVAKDRRRLIEGKTLPARDRLQGLPCRPHRTPDRLHHCHTDYYSLISILESLTSNL